MVNKGGPRTKILRAVARLERLYNGEAPRDQVAMLAGYKTADQAGFKKQLSIIKKDGALELPTRNSMRLTEAGRNEVGSYFDTAPTSNDEFHACIKEFLSPKLKTAFDYLADGRPCMRIKFAKYLDYPNDETAGFKKLLSQLRKQAFVETNGTMVQLAENAFPLGRP
jgi:hypothetical protein